MPTSSHRLQGLEGGTDGFLVEPLATVGAITLEFVVHQPGQWNRHLNVAVSCEGARAQLGHEFATEPTGALEVTVGAIEEVVDAHAFIVSSLECRGGLRADATYAGQAAPISARTHRTHQRHAEHSRR